MKDIYIFLIQSFCRESKYEDHKKVDSLKSWQKVQYHNSKYPSLKEHNDVRQSFQEGHNKEIRIMS